MNDQDMAGPLAKPQAALIACGIACDAILNDGEADDVHGFIVIAWRKGQAAEFTSNTDPAERPAVVMAMREVADRIEAGG